MSFNWEDFKFIMGEKLNGIYESIFLDFKQFPTNMKQKKEFKKIKKKKLKIN
jgi:hypothetical protein